MREIKQITFKKLNLFKKSLHTHKYYNKRGVCNTKLQ